MNEDFYIVPWYNSDEWHQAYQYIFSDTPNIIEALNLLQLWKSRCPALPSGIESTLTLLQVQVQDGRSLANAADDHVARLAYSSAIMRFVNHTLDKETAKGSTLYQAAKNMGVPDWIVELRHDTAHNNTLPSLVLLRDATLFALEWLRNNYWNKQKEHIQDYLCRVNETNEYDVNKIVNVMNFCISLSFCAHPVCEIKYLSEIPNLSMQESLVNDITELFRNTIDLSDLKCVSITSLINTLNSHSKGLLKGKNSKTYVNKVLLGEDSLILSMDLFKFIGGNYIKRSKPLKRRYVQCFDVLFQFLHISNLLLEFITGLIKVTQAPETNHERALLAALWVSEILIALNKSKNFTKKMNLNNTENMSNKKKAEMKALHDHWFPSDKFCGLTLDLNEPVPAELMDINFIHPIISSYNTYLTYFVKDMLHLVEPEIPETVIEKISELAKLISGTSGDLLYAPPPDKIYTIEDLKTEAYDLTEYMEDLNAANIEKKSSSTEFINGIWKLATNKYDWVNCPIGKLPHNEDNQTQMDTEIIK